LPKISFFVPVSQKIEFTSEPLCQTDFEQIPALPAKQQFVVILMDILQPYNLQEKIFGLWNTYNAIFK
jgi:hypothetical protein